MPYWPLQEPTGSDRSAGILAYHIHPIHPGENALRTLDAGPAQRGGHRTGQRTMGSGRRGGVDEAKAEPGLIGMRGSLGPDIQRRAILRHPVRGVGRGPGSGRAYRCMAFCSRMNRYRGVSPVRGGDRQRDFLVHGVVVAAARQGECGARAGKHFYQ